MLKPPLAVLAIVASFPLLGYLGSPFLLDNDMYSTEGKATSRGNKNPAVAG